MKRRHPDNHTSDGTMYSKTSTKNSRTSLLEKLQQLLVPLQRTWERINKNKMLLKRKTLIIAMLIFLCAGVLMLKMAGNRQRRQIGKDHFLSIATIFKNEADILEEWIEHHLWQGVDHFYLINNNSTDDYIHVLMPYIEQNIVTLLTQNQDHAQAETMDSLISHIRLTSEWFMSIDIDEFVFAHPEAGRGNSIKEVLKTLSKPYLIFLNWIQFGSSGHIEQPESVRTGFTRCERKLSKERKYIVHHSGLRGYGTTAHEPVVQGMKTLYGCLLRKLDQCKTNTAVLQINHYPIMSWDRFQKVKMVRGDVSSAKYDNARNEGYFKSYDDAFGKHDCMALPNLVRETNQ